MPRVHTLALTLVLACTAGFAAAQDSLYAPLPGVEYYCRDAAGDRREVGEVMCITASCQIWTARCEMGANNNLTMWRKLQDGCPGASLAPGPKGRLDALKHAL